MISQHRFRYNSSVPSGNKPLPEAMFCMMPCTLWVQIIGNLQYIGIIRAFSIYRGLFFLFELLTKMPIASPRGVSSMHCVGAPEMRRLGYVVTMVAYVLVPVGPSLGHQQPPCWLDYAYGVTWVILRDKHIMLQTLNNGRERPVGQ